MERKSSQLRRFDWLTSEPIVIQAPKRNQEKLMFFVFFFFLPTLFNNISTAHIRVTTTNKKQSIFVLIMATTVHQTVDGKTENRKISVRYTVQF